MLIIITITITIIIVISHLHAACHPLCHPRPRCSGASPRELHYAASPVDADEFVCLHLPEMKQKMRSLLYISADLAVHVYPS